MMKLILLVCVAGIAAAPVSDAAVRQPVRARKAIVVTREAHATDVGVAVLEAGGNAVDAAVAVGLALAVTHPSAGNIGGGGFMLIRLADGRATFLDFRERAPGAASRDMYLDRDGNATDDSQIGYRAAGVPGTVKGLEWAHRKFGRRPWKDLVAPAVELAGKGLPVSYNLAQSLRGKELVLSRFPESKRIFLKGGAFYEPGDVLVQPDLARTLARIGEQGGKDFYEGETARLLAADMKAKGGLITLQDLKGYTVVERRPLTGNYGGYQIITAPPPSSGGVGLLEMLGVLEGTGYERTGAGSAASIHILAETMRRFFAERSEYFGDPEFFHVPTAALLSRRHIIDLRKSIDPEHATPSERVRPGTFEMKESSETTHYSIVDAEGNVVAVTYTLNGGFGCGATATKLGFLLNNEMDDFAVKPGAPNMFGLLQGEGNKIEPNKHPLSSMTPAIVLRDGRFYLVLGSPGGPTIINTVLEVLVNVLDFGMNLQQAVDWPRFHHQWAPDELRMEPGFSPDTIALLKARGHKIKLVDSQGEVAAILSGGGWLQGAPDGRVDATAKGF